MLAVRSILLCLLTLAGAWHASAQTTADTAAHASRAAALEAERSAKAALIAERASQARRQLETSLRAVFATTREVRGLVVSLSDRLFDAGKASLRPEGREKLSRLAGVLLAYPGPYTLEFDGDTGATEGEEFNVTLSRARAEAARDYMVIVGINADRVMEAHGAGRTQSPAGHDTDGRQRNLQVEIVIGEVLDK